MFYYQNAYMVYLYTKLFIILFNNNNEHKREKESLTLVSHMSIAHIPS